MGRFSWGTAGGAGLVVAAVLAVVHGWALLATAERPAGSQSVGERVRVVRLAGHAEALCEECLNSRDPREARLGVVLGAAHAIYAQQRCENCPGAEIEGAATGHAADADARAADRSLADALSAVEELHRERGSALKGTLLDAADLEHEFNIILSNVPAAPGVRVYARGVRASGFAGPGCALPGHAQGAPPAACFTLPCPPPGAAIAFPRPIAGCMQTCSDYPCTAAPAAPVAQHDLVASLRQSSRLLDERSHTLESAGDYAAADQARGLAEHLRMEARQLSGGTSQARYVPGFPVGAHFAPTCPQACPTQSCPAQSCPAQTWFFESFPAPACPIECCPDGTCPGQACPNQACPNRSCPATDCPNAAAPAFFGPGTSRRAERTQVHFGKAPARCEAAQASCELDVNLPAAWLKAISGQCEDCGQPVSTAIQEALRNQSPASGDAEAIFSFFLGFER